MKNLKLLFLFSLSIYNFNRPDTCGNCIVATGAVCSVLFVAYVNYAFNSVQTWNNGANALTLWDCIY